MLTIANTRVQFFFRLIIHGEALVIVLAGLHKHPKVGEHVPEQAVHRPIPLRLGDGRHLGCSYFLKTTRTRVSLNSSDCSLNYFGDSVNLSI